MKKIFKNIFILLFLAVVGFYLYVKYFSVKFGEQAPNFKANLIDGREFSLKDLKGHYVLLDFWGSWCAPCRKENPQLLEFYKKYPKTLKIVTVALEKGSNNWQRVAQADGFIWEHQIVDYNKLVLMSSIAQKYGVTDIPAKFLIDPEGVLLGEMSFSQIDSVLVSAKR